MGEEQLKIVKDYIKKYNLEDELSNAVNQAIKLDSDDPYRVISDYLRKFAKEQDDEYEDDDDVMEEGDEPVMRPAGRRQQVAAKKFEVPDDWAPPVRAEKSPEDKDFLDGVMKTNKLMKNLSPSDRDQLLKAFDKEEFAVGTPIITQGAEGDKFYILNTGVCDISVSGKGTVMKATQGVAFGELALLHGAPRAATVTAEEGPVTAWSLDEITFKMILMGKAKKDVTDYMGFLANVPILQHLKDEERQEIAGALTEQVFEPGKAIICEGDTGSTFYLIRDGEVKCTKVGIAEEVSKRLVAGDFFGELALLSADGDKRAATVTAVAKTTVLTMQKAPFTRLLGELKPPQY